MNRSRSGCALLLTLSLTPAGLGCDRLHEPLGHKDGGVAQDGGGSRAGRGSDAGPGSLVDLAGSRSPEPVAGRYQTPTAGVAGTYTGGVGGADYWPWGYAGTGERYWGGAGGNSGDAAPWVWLAGSGGQVYQPGGGWGGTWYGGGVGGGEYWYGASGAQPCDCEDNDPCTMDYCSNRGGCRHDSQVTAAIDADDDGFEVGCDCNDANAEVKPTQTKFFSEEPEAESEFSQPFDYDCDYSVTPLLIGNARECELHPAGGACLGDGWLGDGPPECGEEAEYQVCEFEDGACVPKAVNTVQRCR